MIDSRTIGYNTRIHRLCVSVIADLGYSTKYIIMCEIGLRLSIVGLDVLGQGWVYWDLDVLI